MSTEAPSGFKQFEWDVPDPPDPQREADNQRALHSAQQLPRDWTWYEVAYPSWTPSPCRICGGPPVLLARRTDLPRASSEDPYRGAPEPPDFEVRCHPGCEVRTDIADDAEGAISEYGRAVEAYFDGDPRVGEEGYRG